MLFCKAPDCVIWEVCRVLKGKHVSAIIMPDTGEDIAFINNTRITTWCNTQYYTMHGLFLKHCYKCTPHFFRQHFQIPFSTTKMCEFIQILLKLAPKGPVDNTSPNRRQTITRIKAEPINWHIYASPGVNGLIYVHQGATDISRAQNRNTSLHDFVLLGRGLYHYHLYFVVAVNRLDWFARYKQQCYWTVSPACFSVKTKTVNR